MDEFCNCARGLGAAAETLFFAIAFQSVAASMFFVAAMMLV